MMMVVAWLNENPVMMMVAWLIQIFDDG